MRRSAVRPLLAFLLGGCGGVVTADRDGAVDTSSMETAASDARVDSANDATPPDSGASTDGTTPCDLTGRWTGTRARNECGGGPLSSTTLVMDLVQAGTTMSGTSGTLTVTGTIAGTNVALQEGTSSDVERFSYTGKLTSCDAIDGSWVGSLTCDYGSFTLHRP